MSEFDEQRHDKPSHEETQPSPSPGDAENLAPAPTARFLGKLDKLLIFLGKAFVIAAAIVFSASYVYFSPPVLTRTNGGFILFPMPPGPEYQVDSVNNIKRQECWFKNNKGNKLEGWYFESRQAENPPVVLFSHGNAGNIGHRLMLAKWLMDAGASVFLFDYRSYGRSEGKKDLKGLVDDSRAAYKYMTCELKIPPERIVLYGESVGGGPTCQLIKELPAAGVILDSCFSSLLHVAKKKVEIMNIYPDFLQPDPPYDNRAAIAGKHPPVLIIHGIKDEVIPYSEAELNFASASEPKTLLSLPHSTHNWKDADSEAYVRGIAAFLESIKAIGKSQ